MSTDYLESCLTSINIVHTFLSCLGLYWLYLRFMYVFVFELRVDYVKGFQVADANFGCSWHTRGSVRVEGVSYMPQYFKLNVIFWKWSSSYITHLTECSRHISKPFEILFYFAANFSSSSFSSTYYLPIIFYRTSFNITFVLNLWINYNCTYMIHPKISRNQIFLLCASSTFAMLQTIHNNYPIFIGHPLIETLR